MEGAVSEISADVVVELAVVILAPLLLFVLEDSLLFLGRRLRRR